MLEVTVHVLKIAHVDNYCDYNAYHNLYINCPNENLLKYANILQTNIADGCIILLKILTILFSFRAIFLLWWLACDIDKLLFCIVLVINLFYCFIGNFMYLFIDVFLNKLNFIVIVISWSLFAQSFKINNILFQRTQAIFIDCMIHDTFKFMSSDKLCYKFQSSN